MKKIEVLTITLEGNKNYRNIDLTTVKSIKVEKGCYSFNFKKEGGNTKGGITVNDKGTYTAVVNTNSNDYKTLRGALNFMAKYGYKQVFENEDNQEVITEVEKERLINIAEEYKKEILADLEQEENIDNSNVEAIEIDKVENKKQFKDLMQQVKLNKQYIINLFSLRTFKNVELVGTIEETKFSSFYELKYHTRNGKKLDTIKTIDFYNLLTMSVKDIKIKALSEDIESYINNYNNTGVRKEN